MQAHVLAQAGDHNGAVRAIKAALAERPEERVLLGALAGLQQLARDVAAATASIARLAARGPQFPARDPAGPARVPPTASTGAAEASARAALAANPGGAAARHALAAHDAVAGDYAAVFEEWLALVQRDRAYCDDIAGRSILAVFEVLAGPTSGLHPFRRRMASLLH